MRNALLRLARQSRGWNQQQLADLAGVSLSTIERAERGEDVRVDTIERLCACFEKTPLQLGLLQRERQGISRREANKTIAGLLSGLLLTTASGFQNEPEAGAVGEDDLLVHSNQGIKACQDLYFSGNPYQVEALLPLYCTQAARLASTSSTIQKRAARLASLAFNLACELSTDREDFGAAEKSGRQALCYAQAACDSSLQVAALINLANLGFHRKLTLHALSAYQQAEALFSHDVSPLLKGRAYAGMAEVYAMRRQLQESMWAMGRAYEHYPLHPEDDPAYQYLRSSRYSLFVFGDAQSRLFLHQPKEADRALVAMQQETNDPQIEPITKVDLLYYQAEVQIQLGELGQSSAILTEAGELAKSLGSRLYFNKLAQSFEALRADFPKERAVKALEEVFAPW